MCGLAGILAPEGDPGRFMPRITAMLRHRGPDNEGVWSDAAAGIALGHRRLSIIDTSSAGHQPMVSHCGRHVLVLNGEIYNHQELRRDLAAAGAAPPWRGHSDTETLLAAIAQWGLAEALTRASGMFALAVWDRSERRLELARDRLGEKPLYYAWAGGNFLFASELKAIRAHPGFVAELSREALGHYLRFGYVPSPFSIWTSAFKLEAGTILRLSGPPPAAPAMPLRSGARHGGLSIARYWSLAQVAEEGAAAPPVPEAEALDLLETTLERAVARQMMSDVPLGAFLSGGIDSSLVVALMQKSSARPVRSFTVGFDERDFDESAHAAAVARHIGTEHTEIRLTSAEALAAIPLMPGIFDEPFADASQIPTFLISRAARSAVTVALTGDGGDELFGGYARYQRVPELWAGIGALPPPLRRTLGGAIAAVPAPCWALMAGFGNAQAAPFGDRMLRLARRLVSTRNIDDLYLDLVAAWPDPGAVARLPQSHDDGALPIADPVPPALLRDPVARMMYLDALTYLPDDILCKVDRCSMSVGLETRAPLLDPAVAALAWRLPAGMKVRNRAGKWALRQVLHRHVPKALVERPKLGFFLPVGPWLRGPLRGWAEELLAEDRLAREGIFDPKAVRRMWQEHVEGRRDFTLQAWTILMFQAWAEANLGLPPEAMPAAM